MGSLAALPALDVRPPTAQPDVLTNLERIMQFKSQQRQDQMQQQEAPLRVQALQQQVQAGGVDLQQKQQAQKDQQALTASMQDWDGKNYQDLYPLILKNGGSASAVLGLKTHVLDQQKSIALAAKDNADAAHAGIQATLQKNDLITGALGALADPQKTPDAQLAQSLTQTVQSLTQQGVLDPQHAQAAAQLAQSGDPTAIRNGITQFNNTLRAQSQITEEGLKHAQTEASQASVVRGQAETQQAAQNAAETARYHNIEAGQRQQQIGIEGARLAFDKQRQGTQDDASVEALAQQVAKYDQPMPSMGRNSPFNRAVTARALEINPNLSKEGYDTQQDFFSSKGKANAQVQSLNKLSAHLNELQQTSEKAGFSPVGFTSAGKDLRLAEQLFSKEDVKFLSGSGVGTEGELNALIDKIHSPIQSVRTDAIKTLSSFTADAAQQLGNQYTKGTKQPFDPAQHFTPDTINLLKNHSTPGSVQGASGGGATVTAPNGKTYTFKDQAAADAFKQSAGIK